LDQKLDRNEMSFDRCFRRREDNPIKS